MGRDKALLEFRGRPLIENIAETLAAVSPSVTIVGPAERYAHFGLPVIEDRRPGLGPLAGIESALLESTAARCLIVACDMPDLSLDLLRRLSETQADCAMPKTPDGRLHPLCAVWSRKLLLPVQQALDNRRLKVLDCLQGADIVEVPVESLSNANTPEEWLRVAG